MSSFRAVLIREFPIATAPLDTPLAHVQPRHVAVSVPYRRSAEGIEVCLVSSRKHEDRWVLPKGGIEEGESEAEAAIRELHEEGK